MNSEVSPYCDLYYLWRDFEVLEGLRLPCRTHKDLGDEDHVASQWYVRPRPVCADTLTRSYEGVPVLACASALGVWVGGGV